MGCSVTTGTTVRVVNPKGHQVVDLWAFVESDPTEYLSMAHNRTAHYTTRFQAGHVLVSNRFMKLLRFIEDTTDGLHDSFHAACSAQSYAHFGSDRQYPNCEDNLQKTLHDAGIAFQITPPPWNLFEKSFVDEDGDQPVRKLAITWNSMLNVIFLWCFLHVARRSAIFKAVTLPAHRSISRTAKLDKCILLSDHR